MINEQLRYADRIIRDPEILVGKPVIKGTRIPVAVVLEYLAHNPNLDELFADYPRLTMADVQACLEYAQTLVQEESIRTTAPEDARRPYEYGTSASTRASATKTSALKGRSWMRSSGSQG